MIFKGLFLLKEIICELGIVSNIGEWEIIINWDFLLISFFIDIIKVSWCWGERVVLGLFNRYRLFFLNWWFIRFKKFLLCDWWCRDLLLYLEKFKFIFFVYVVIL